VRQSRFRGSVERHFPEHRTWSVAQLTGYLKSTSFGSPAVLGDRMAAFERDLAQRLQAVHPNAPFTATVETTVVLATKTPPAAAPA